MTNLCCLISAKILKRDHAPSLGCWEGICTQLTVSQSIRFVSCFLFQHKVRHLPDLPNPSGGHRVINLQQHFMEFKHNNGSPNMATSQSLKPGNIAFTLPRKPDVIQLRIVRWEGLHWVIQVGPETTQRSFYVAGSVAQCQSSCPHVQGLVCNHQYYKNKARALANERGRPANQRLRREQDNRSRGKGYNLEHDQHCCVEDGDRDCVPKNAGILWKLEKKATYRTLLYSS